jgi:hypothetical protein
MGIHHYLPAPGMRTPIGDDSLEMMANRVAGLEQALSINDLAKFMPR